MWGMFSREWCLGRIGESRWERVGLVRSYQGPESGDVALCEAEALGTDAQRVRGTFHMIQPDMGSFDKEHEGVRETRTIPGLQPVLKPAGK